MSAAFREKLSAKCFNGYQKVVTHYSKITNCEMQFAIYLPPQCEYCTRKLPVVYFLSGLGFDHYDFIDKSASQKVAADLGLIIVAPDNSPRNTNIPGEKDKWNVGTKASFYVDAIREPWNKHYKMHSYLSQELPDFVTEHFPVLPDKQSIMGFSVGGHGAFHIMARNPSKFRSISLLSPVCDITRAPLSFEALEQYLGKREDANWDEWSAVAAAKRYKGPPFHILIDQGTADEYLKEHLHLDDFMDSCTKSGITVNCNLRNGYGHNYFYLKTFLPDHLKYHSQQLQ